MSSSSNDDCQVLSEVKKKSRKRPRDSEVTPSPSMRYSNPPNAFEELFGTDTLFDPPDTPQSDGAARHPPWTAPQPQRYQGYNYGYPQQNQYYVLPNTQRQSTFGYYGPPQNHMWNGGPPQHQNGFSVAQPHQRASLDFVPPSKYVTHNFPNNNPNPPPNPQMSRHSVPNYQPNPIVDTPLNTNDGDNGLDLKVEQMFPRNNDPKSVNRGKSFPNQNQSLQDFRNQTSGANSNSLSPHSCLECVNMGHISSENYVAKGEKQGHVMKHVDSVMEMQSIGSKLERKTLVREMAFKCFPHHATKWFQGKALNPPQEASHVEAQKPPTPPTDPPIHQDTNLNEDLEKKDSKSHHSKGKKITQEDRLDNCTICGITIKGERKILYRLRNDHVKQHNNVNYSCPNCNYSAQKQHQVRQHLKVTHPQSKGAKIKTTNWNAEQGRLRELCFPRKSTAGTQTSPATATQVLTSNLATEPVKKAARSSQEVPLIINLDEIAPNNKSSNAVPPQSGNPNLVCRICTQTVPNTSRGVNDAASMGHLHHHVKKHNEMKKFQCPNCPHLASQLSNLTSHIRVHHPNCKDPILTSPAWVAEQGRLVYMCFSQAPPPPVTDVYPPPIGRSVVQNGQLTKDVSHGGVNVAETLPSTYKDDIIKCHMCGEELKKPLNGKTTAWNIKNGHVMKHNFLAEIHCPECGFKGRTYSYVHQHLKKAHPKSQQKPIVAEKWKLEQTKLMDTCFPNETASPIRAESTTVKPTLSPKLRNKKGTLTIRFPNPNKNLKDVKSTPTVPTPKTTSQYTEPDTNKTKTEAKPNNNCRICGYKVQATTKRLLIKAQTNHSMNHNNCMGIRCSVCPYVGRRLDNVQKHIRMAHKGNHVNKKPNISPEWQREQDAVMKRCFPE